MQTSESFRLSALLSFSGGLQDAYTYNVRAKVFANAQTGNLVLMSQNFLEGNLMQGLHYVCPLFSFALGVFVAERIESRFKSTRNLHWRQIILLVEIFTLILVGFLPSTMNLPANMLVSFSCALQLQTFRKVRGYGYASTMCIGNLRSGTESLSCYLRSKDKNSLKKALHFYGIIFVFSLGAGVGGVLSGFLGIHTIWLSGAILFCVMLMMQKENTTITFSPFSHILSYSVQERRRDYDTTSYRGDWR